MRAWRPPNIDFTDRDPCLPWQLSRGAAVVQLCDVATFWPTFHLGETLAKSDPVGGDFEPVWLASSWSLWWSDVIKAWPNVDGGRGSGFDTGQADIAGAFLEPIET